MASLDLGPVNPHDYPSLNVDDYDANGTLWELPELKRILQEELKGEGIRDSTRKLLECRSIQVCVHRD